jgi:hypothetical protein
MHAESEQMLQEIGRQLDKDIFPRVKNGGIVMPSELAEPSLTVGVENRNDKTSRQRRSEARSGKGASGRQGSAGRSWPPRQTPPVVRTSLQAQYKDELGTAVLDAYPRTQVWCQEEGLWLLTESSLLPGFQQRALFLTGISFARAVVKGWGFWGGVVVGSTWIGPRHTNFPEGSICAFEPTDGTWVIGDPIVELLDLYTLWALRHLHLQVFGRWPGYQAVRHPYERILELREDEHCGCGESDKLYGECCRDGDLRRNRIVDAVNFVVCYSGGLREPPSSVVRFIREQIDLPRFSDLFA